MQEALLGFATIGRLIFTEAKKGDTMKDLTESNWKQCDHCERSAVIVIDNYKYECAECHLEKLKRKGAKFETYTSGSRTFGFSKSSGRSFTR